MSDFRRAAASLLEPRTERFESRHGVEESRRRLKEALARLRPPPATRFVEAWSESGGKALLAATYEPSTVTRLFLHLASLGFVLLIAASAWALSRSEGAARYLLPMVTVLGVLGFPFVTLGMSSARDAEESRIRRAIRAALLDEDEKYPPPQRWNDED